MRDRAARSIVLILDENLSGHRIVDGLIKNSIPIKPQTELMPRGIPDEEVLRNLANRRNCYLLSKDSDFHRKPGIKDELIRHRIGAFVITSHKNKTGPELVELISSAWNRINQYARNHHRPFVVKILADGHIKPVA